MESENFIHSNSKSILPELLGYSQNQLPLRLIVDPRHISTQVHRRGSHDLRGACGEHHLDTIQDEWPLRDQFDNQVA